ncbi:hypothetical protein [Streptomyces sp. TLI_171]|uniref:hypothetical protein n=1 Tax=Streptomyces sp. TLI_171 TaxID=1938859 RepID=UPI000C18D862|nr:hypothetical protein [Streptomyces sp. TLI_171]RKE17297.1 rubredoxin-like zinc ribbon protein [Streptomyces sp. TLI_171]
MPATTVDPPTVPYQRCRWCRTPHAGPRLLCTTCGSTDLDDELSPGFGRIVRLTEASRRHGRPKQRCLVAVDEGFVVAATATGLPGAIQLGLRVRLEAPADELRRDFVVRAGA